MIIKILSIFMIIADIAAFVYDVTMLISVFKAKELAVISSVTNISSIISCLVIAFIPAIVIGFSGLIYLLITFALLFSLSYVTFLSPEGIRVSMFINGGIIPKETVSYEYSGRMLKLYLNNSKKPLMFNIASTKTKTVKMLIISNKSDT